MFRKKGVKSEMLKYLLIACCISIGVCQQTDIAILEEHMPNGDESETVSIDLTKLDGSEGISLMAQLQFHLNEGQVHVNGNPIIHSIVNSVCMRISITEIKRGTLMAPRLVPVTFRVLVMEKLSENGDKKVVAEFEFIKVEQYDVIQVDVKQIMWEGSNRRPVTSISFQDSAIHHKPHEQDHRVFPDPDPKPPLPLDVVNEGYKHRSRNRPHYREHNHQRDNQSEVVCWFKRLTVGGKIAVIFTVALTFLGLLLSLIVCWKRHFYQKNLNVEAPIDNFTEADECSDNSAEKDEKNVTVDEGRFHVQMNACVVDVDHKKALVE